MENKYIHIPKTRRLDSSSKYVCKKCLGDGRNKHRWQCPYCLGSGALVYFNEKELRIKGIVLPVDLQIKAHILHFFYSENYPCNYLIRGFYWRHDPSMKSGSVKACDLMVRLGYKDVVWKEVCIDLSILMRTEWFNADEIKADCIQEELLQKGYV